MNKNRAFVVIVAATCFVTSWLVRARIMSHTSDSVPGIVFQPSRSEDEVPNHDPDSDSHYSADGITMAEVATETNQPLALVRAALDMQYFKFAVKTTKPNLIVRYHFKVTGKSKPEPQTMITRVVPKPSLFYLYLGVMPVEGNFSQAKHLKLVMVGDRERESAVIENPLRGCVTSRTGSNYPEPQDLPLMEGQLTISPKSPVRKLLIHLETQEVPFQLPMR